MPLYAYQAIDNSNKRVKGSVTAHTQEEAEAQVREKGLFPISIRAKAKGSSFFALSQKVTKKDLLGFTIQLHLMFTAGLPLLDSLKSIAEQSKNPKLRELVEDIGKRVETTGSFSEAIAAHPKVFPPFYLGAVRAGEAGGTLPEMLNHLAESLEKQEELQSEMKQALIYPVMIMFVMSAVTGFYAFYLMPKMMVMVEELGAPVPFYTRAIQFVVNGIIATWIPLVVLIIGGVVATFIYGRSESGRYTLSYLRLKLPLFGAVIQKSVLCSFAHYLSLLLHSGFGLLASLDLVRGTIGNPTIVRSIETMEERISRGESFAGSMRGLSFPGFMVTMIGLGEQTGKVPEQLARINEYFEKDVRRTTKQVLTIMEPLILIVFGGISAVILMSTFIPMYSALGQVK
jgi:type IV pilus assembly protein PilC